MAKSCALCQTVADTGASRGARSPFDGGAASVKGANRAAQARLAAKMRAQPERVLGATCPVIEITLFDFSGACNSRFVPELISPDLWHARRLAADDAPSGRRSALDRLRPDRRRQAWPCDRRACRRSQPGRELRRRLDGAAPDPNARARRPGWRRPAVAPQSPSPGQAAPERR